MSGYGRDGIRLQNEGCMTSWSDDHNEEHTTWHVIGVTGNHALVLHGECHGWIICYCRISYFSSLQFIQSKGKFPFTVHHVTFMKLCSSLPQLYLIATQNALMSRHLFSN